MHIAAKENWINTVPMSVTVQRKRTYEQAMSVFLDWDESDWQHDLLVKFADEPGVDAEGVRREFFTLFFAQCSIIEGGSLKYQSDLVDNEEYYALGEVAAKAILTGHPGVGKFSDLASYYLVKKRNPTGENGGRLHHGH